MNAPLRARCGAELLGTFAIVFFGCGSMAVLPASGGVTTQLTVNTVFGLTVAAMIYALGHISAAHFNPAVTLGFAAARQFPWRDVAPYVAAQVAGAVLASTAHALFLPAAATAANYGATIPAVTGWRCVGMEAVLTFFLTLVILSVATDRRAPAGFAGLAVGATVTLCGLFGGPLTGCSMNPARSLAPALFAGPRALGCLWIFVAGPVLGAILAAAAHQSLRHSSQLPADQPELVVTGRR